MAALVERSRAGDRSALEQLLESYDGEVLNVAYRMIGHKDDAMDIRQSAYLRVWRSLERFDGRCSFRTWLLRIVINLCRDHIRRGGADRRRADGWTEHASLRDDSYHAERDFGGEQSQRMTEAVGGLADNQREVLVLRHYHGMTLTAVAELLEIPLSTAASRLASALRRLRELLCDWEPDGDDVSGAGVIESKGAGHAV